MKKQCETCCFCDACDGTERWWEKCRYYAPCGDAETESAEHDEREYAEFLEAWCEYVNEYE